MMIFDVGPIPQLDEVIDSNGPNAARAAGGGKAADSWPLLRTGFDKLKNATDRRISRRLRQTRSILTNRLPFVIKMRCNLNGYTSQPPWIAFREASDEFWLWANTHGCRYFPALQERLPRLPPEHNQLAVGEGTGDASLRRGFALYRLFRDLIQTHYKLVADCDAVLDYGCGWGRILRFFLKDLDGEKLWGVDILENQILWARKTNPYSHFEAVGENPPTSLPSNAFDVVFANSVFSHVSEETHRLLLKEFSRVLVPDGLVIATTWGRDRGRRFEAVARGQIGSRDSHYQEMMARQFPGRKAWEDEYEDVGFAHVDLDYTGVTGYGETSISRPYVEKHWGGDFRLVDFISNRSVHQQDIIVIRKVS